VVAPVTHALTGKMFGGNRRRTLVQPEATQSVRIAPFLKLRCLSTSRHVNDLDAYTGIKRVKQEIPAVDVVNVNLIGVIPVHRPRINKSEPIAAVLEA